MRMVELIPWNLASVSRQACIVNEYSLLNVRGRVISKECRRRKEGRQG